MAKPIHTASRSFANLTVLDELMNVSDSVNVSIQLLCSHAKPPLDGACLLFVCQGAERAFAAAMETLREPNANAISVHEQLKELASACKAIYASRDIADVYTTMKRRLHDNAAWAAMAKLGSLDADASTGIAAAIGVNLGLAWAGKKLLAGAFMTALRKCLTDEVISVEELMADLANRVEHSDENWLKQFSKFLPDFWACFDTHDHPPPRPKTIAEKAISEWKGRSAFPTYRRRAAVLDKTCFSRSQIAQACEWTPSSGFNDREEYQIALWLVGFTGLNVESVHRIPIVGSDGITVDETWAVQYDIASGLLLRDYSAMAGDSARAEGKISEPASYVIALPAPQRLADYIRARCMASPAITDFGDLIPLLRRLTPESNLYTTLGELKPSWARWSRSLGPHMRQLGFDNFLTGVMVGDLGMTARSKLYYARVQAAEIWAVAGAMYAELGLDAPAAMPIGQIAFGTQVVPASTAIQEIDVSNINELGALWPGKRCSLEKEITFHNAYVLALGFRFMVRFSLRAAACFPLSAAIDEDTDTNIDVVEKSSAERKGGFAALITDAARQELRLLRAHCKAFLQRLKTRGQNNSATQWLEAVASHADVPLMTLISADGSITSLTTKAVLDEVCKGYRLAEDFGRKWNENAMRTAGCRTGDIDRMLRHEVKGQEATTTLSDCSEDTWVRRTKATIEPLHNAFFSKPLRGLRKE